MTTTNQTSWSENNYQNQTRRQHIDNRKLNLTNRNIRFMKNIACFRMESPPTKHHLKNKTGMFCILETSTKAQYDCSLPETWSSEHVAASDARSTKRFKKDKSGWLTLWVKSDWNHKLILSDYNFIATEIKNILVVTSKKLNLGILNGSHPSLKSHPWQIHTHWLTIIV